jgi:hypothetical protein
MKPHWGNEFISSLRRVPAISHGPVFEPGLLPTMRHGAPAAPRMILHFAILLLAALFIFAPSPAGAASLTLSCRGGGGMKMEIRHRIAAKAWVIVTFRRATQAVSAQPPGPGECGWLDHAPTIDEPDSFAASFAGIAFDPELTADGRLLSLGISEDPEDGAADARRRDAEKLINAIRNGAAFRLNVNIGFIPVLNRRAYIVTRLGP